MCWYITMRKSKMYCMPRVGAILMYPKLTFESIISRYTTFLASALILPRVLRRTDLKRFLMEYSTGWNGGLVRVYSFLGLNNSQGNVVFSGIPRFMSFLLFMFVTSPLLKVASVSFLRFRRLFVLVVERCCTARIFCDKKFV